MSRIFPSARGGAKPLFRLTLIVLTCAPVQALRAQEQSSAPVSLPEISVTAAPSAQPGSLNLTVPSTAGSRLNLTPLQTPASVSLIPGDQIRDQGDTTISEAESRAVGVTQVPFTGNGNNSLSARGFYGPNSITQLYDGMQLFNAGGVVAFPFDPWNVDRIEVLLGSSSTLYGTGGIGGAINVVPLQPDPTRQSEKFQSSYGSFGTVHAAADVTGPINQMVSYRFDVSQYKSNGWVQPDGGSSSLAISGVLRFELSPELVVTLRDDYGHFNPSDYEGTPILDGHVIDALRFINYNVSDGQVDFNTNTMQLKAVWTPSSFLSVTNDLYYITQGRRYYEGYMWTFNPTNNTVTRQDFRDINAEQIQIGDHGFITLKSQPFGFDNETLVGFDVNHSNYNRYDNQSGAGTSEGISTVNAFDFSPGTFASTGATAARHQYILDLDQVGVFAEDRLSLTSQFSVLAGVRFDKYDTNLLAFPGGGQTPGIYTGVYTGPGYHIGGIYNPTPTTALYARYSVATDPVTSLASDSIADIAFGLSPAQQTEVGAKGSFFDNRLQATTALYEIVKHNLLTPSLQNPAVLETVGQQSSRGIEVAMSYKLTDRLHFEVNGTALNARFDNYLASFNGGVINLAGKLPQFVPESAANFIAHWSFLKDWDLRCLLQYVGTRYSDNTDLYKLPAYAIFGVGLRYNVTKNINVDLRIDNITNSIYAVSTYAGNSTQLILGEPRSVTGTLNVNF
jgi:iron complex outermembrane recepter protein